MKKKLTILSTALILAGCSASASGATLPQPVHETQINQFQPLLLARQAKVNENLKALKARVGKTWYVFSGWQPTGWDCSGLTMWFADRLGYAIPHSANKQAKLSGVVKAPEPGDLVLFGYKSGKTFFHAAVYIGDNKVIHAGFRPGQRTSVLDLTSPSVKNLKVRFIRLG